MKIIIVDSTLQGPLIGGAQTFLPGLLRGLTDNGYEVHLVSRGIPHQKVLNDIKVSGAQVHSNIWKNHQMVEDAAPVFARWVNSLKPDIYLISVSPDIGWVVLPYLDPSITTLAIAHSNSDEFYLPAKHYKKFLSGVVGVSHEICDKYQTISEIDKEKIQWIPYGVKASLSGPQQSEEEAIKLVFLGRLEEADKRISDVALIIKKLVKEKIPYTFTIVGDGSRKNYLTELLEEEINKGNVRFTGWLKNEEILEILRASEIFILTSSSEGFSIALTEALANGCCPVVTNIPSGSIQLIEDGRNGCLVEVGDIDGFIQKIRFLFADREALYQMREAAWATGKEFTLLAMVNRYESFFKHLINTRQLYPRKADPTFPLMPVCVSKYPRWIRKFKSYAKQFGLLKE